MPTPSGARILIVDDEEDIGTSMAAYLRQSTGADVRVAPSARAALEALLYGPPVHLILCDFRMPGMTGLEFLRRVSETHPDVPRIMLTAYADASLEARAHKEAKVLRFLRKPVEPRALADIVRSLLDGRVHAA